MECVRLDEHPLEIQLTEKPLEHGPLVVLAGGVAGLADGHTQGRGVERHLGNERGSAASGGLGLYWFSCWPWGETNGEAARAQAASARR